MDWLRLEASLFLQRPPCVCQACGWSGRWSTSGSHRLTCVPQAPNSSHRIANASEEQSSRSLQQGQGLVVYSGERSIASEWAKQKVTLQAGASLHP